MLLLPSARRLRVTTKETSIDVKLKTKVDECKVQEITQIITMRESNKRIKIKEKSNECKIEEINNLYKEKYPKFLYYQRVAKHVVIQVGNDARKVGHHKFQHALSSCSLKFTHTTCTTTNQNLKQEDFVDFFHLIDITCGTQKHVIEAFLT